MLRLAVDGNPPLWPAVKARLQGATFIEGINIFKACTENESLLDTFDAVLFDNSRCVDQLLRRGKHVVAHAPLWWPQKLSELEDLAKQSNATFAIINPDDFRPSRQLVFQQLQSGHLGDPGLIRLHRWDSADHSPAALSDKWLFFPLLRDIHTALRLMGRSPDVAFATEAVRIQKPVSGQRTLQLHLGFPNGGMALIDYSSGLPEGDVYQSLSVIGSSGAVYADDHQNVQLLYQGGTVRAVKVDEQVRAWANAAQYFIDAINSNRDLSSTVTAWQTTWKVSSAAVQSLTTHQAVRLEDMSA